MKMNRRFLYMLVKATFGGRHGSYTLRRISPSRLFYRKDSPERAAAAGAARATASEAAARVVKNARLPPPTTKIRFRSIGYPHFELLGRDKDKILVVDLDDNTASPVLLYDDRSRSFDYELPSLRRPFTIVNPFYVVVGDGLYFMDSSGDDGDNDDCHDEDGDDFEDSEDDDDSHEEDDDDRHEEDDEDGYASRVNALVPDCDGQYSWRDVPPPPHERMDWNSGRRAYAAVGESSIWVSAGSHGTLALDTASGAWSKVGDWRLPFVGRAVHAPDPAEHGSLWFGFPPRSTGPGRWRTGTHLEAWDLHADGGPASRLRWVADMPGMFNEHVVQSEVAVLGDGRLCVGRLFEDYRRLPSRGHCSCCYYRTEQERKRPFATLTGLEVVDDGQGLRLIEHKSGVGARHFPEQRNLAKFLF